MEARKGWLGIFRPNLAGAILWLIILAVDVLLFSQARSTTEISLEPWDSYTEWQKVTGLPAVMKHQVTYREEEVVGGSTEVYWLTLLAVLTVTYFLAMALGNQIRIRSTAGVGRRMAITVASAVLLAFVASIGISQWMWNYPFARPNVLVDVKQIQEVSSISPVVLRGGRFEPIEGYSIQVEAKGNPQEGGYYNLSQRVLMSLKIHDKLPAKPRMADRATFANYLGALMQSGILVKSAEGYASSDELAGNVVEYKSLNGNDRVFMGVRGGQVSNDHYPYYEMLFAREGDKLRYLDSQMFYFDVAGMEGAEWHGFFQVLAILLTPLALAVHCVIEIARGMRSKSRLARSACRAS